MSGDQVSIMVDGVQVALPSYEEAVYGSTGNCIPPSDSRVQIVLSEGAGQNGAREMQQQDQGAHNGLDREMRPPDSLDCVKPVALSALKLFLCIRLLPLPG